jgi:O-antigen/teichoic acid export membrane protein
MRWKNLVTNVMTLKNRIINAGLWTAGAYGVELFTRLFTNVVLTRFLFPEAFGIIAASTSLIVGLALISDFGIRAVVIQNKNGESAEFLRSAWVFQLSRGIILWVILAVACGVLSIPAIQNSLPPHSVFADHAFPILTAVLGLQLPLSGLESTAIALNVRRLNYRSIVIVDLAGRIVPIPVMVATAILYPSAWALVVGALAGGAARVVLSHFAIPGPRMALKWEQTHFKEIVHFGKWITASSIATFAGSQSDIIIFGLVLPNSILGLYFLAKGLTDAVEGLLERLNGTLTLPVLGEVLRNTPQFLQNRYYRFRLPLEVVAAFFSGFVFATANLIVSLLYDVRYAGAGPMLQILSLNLLLYPSSLIRGAFTAVGQTKIVATISAIQAISLVLFLTVGYLVFGIMGAIAGVVLGRSVPAVALLYLANTRNWINFLHELRTILIFASGLLMGQVALSIAKLF